MFYPRIWIRAGFALVFLSGLAACGGGGGLSSGTPGPAANGNRGSGGTSETVAQLQQRPEYQRHAQLGLMDALKVHAAGYRGAGAKIAVVDMPLARSQELVDDRRKTLNNPFYSDLQAVQGRASVIFPLDPEVPDPTPPSYTTGEDIVTYENAYVDAMHGTIVTQIAAGRYQQLSTDEKGNAVGVAPEASVSTFGIPSCQGTSTPSWCRSDNPLNLVDATTHALTDSNFANLLKELTGAYDVVNFSFSFPGQITSYSANDYALVHSIFDDALTELEQLGRDSPTKRNTTAFVVAAGNSGDPNPELLPGFPVVRTSLQSHMIAVVATEGSDADDPLSSQVIASYSNRCGVAKDYCIAAPGQMTVYLPGPDQDTSATTEARGTSFAAPRVSGALAVLAGRVTVNGKRQTTMAELVQRVFDTADNDGIYANQDIYGKGLLDMDAALRAVGELIVTAGNSLNGPAHVFSSSRLAGGRASGDALERAFAGRQLMLFDALDFPFPVPLRSLLDNSATERDTERALWQRLDWLGRDAHSSLPGAGWHVNGFSALPPTPGGAAQWFGATGGESGTLFPEGAADLGGHLGLLGRPLGVGYAWNAASWDARTAMFSTTELNQANAGLVSQLRPRNAGKFGPRWTLGLLHRSRYLLDTLGTGGIEAGGSATMFTGLGGRYRMGERWWLRYGMALGYTHLRAASGSLLRGGTPLLTTEGEVGLARSDLLRTGDRFGLRLHQPLRVEHGALEVGYALYRTPERGIIQETFNASLEPSGRHLSLEGVYRIPLAEDLEAGLLLRWGRQPGHIRGADSEFDLLGALRLQL